MKQQLEQSLVLYKSMPKPIEALGRPKLYTSVNLESLSATALYASGDPCGSHHPMARMNGGKGGSNRIPLLGETADGKIDSKLRAQQIAEYAAELKARESESIPLHKTSTYVYGGGEDGLKPLIRYDTADEHHATGHMHMVEVQTTKPHIVHDSYQLDPESCRAAISRMIQNSFIARDKK